MLYSVYIPYNDDNIAEITDNDYFEGIENLHPAITALTPTFNCSVQAREKAYEYVVNIRKNQALQTILWDTLSDSKFIDSVISENACTAIFNENGNLVSLDTGNADEEYNIFNMGLIDIFKTSFAQIIS